MIDSTHLKAHRTAASLLKRGIHPRFIGRTKGGLNSKLHAVCDGAGRSVIFLLTEGQMSDSMRYDRCAHILQRYLHRGNRYLLARTISPDPSGLGVFSSGRMPVKARGPIHLRYVCA